MTEIGHIWACRCGVETPCAPEDMLYGSVFECPACKHVWGCLYPRGGGKAWVKLTPADVEFHYLLGRRDNEQDRMAPRESGRPMRPR